MATVDGVSTESVNVAQHEESDPIHPTILKFPILRVRRSAQNFMRSIYRNG